MDPQHFLRVGICGMLGQAATHQWLSWCGDSTQKPCVAPGAGFQFPTEHLLNTCLVASSWLLVVLGVLGYSGGRAPLPRLVTLAGALAQRSPP